jgi:hypothetical protein
MKKPLMLTLLIFSVAAGGTYADHGSFVIAQAESPATAPTPAPVWQPETVPSVPAPQTESAPAPQQEPATPAAAETAPPTPAEGTSGVSTKGFMAHQLSHKDFATMDLKECAKCHKGSGIAPTHGTDQLLEHGFLARRAGKNCVDCHNQQFCLDCHRGGGINADLSISNYRTNYIPKTHRTDFREIHPIKALDNPQTCTKCHDARFCSQCHAKFRGEDLMVQSHRKGFSDLPTSSGGPLHSTFSASQCQTCHPGGLLPEHVWSAAHAQEARRNLQACQTCHSDGDVCMTCHSARRGLMVNPHPRNWSAVKDRYRSRSGGRSCIKCHDNY